MKCPKCGYNSFDHLDSCKKCSTDLTEHKAKFNLRGFYSPQLATGAEAAPEFAVDDEPDTPEPSADGSVDFGFDFLDEEGGADEAAPGGVPLGDNDQDVNIDQPFGVDSETIPADDLSFEGDSDDKPEKGPEFAF